MKKLLQLLFLCLAIGTGCKSGWINPSKMSRISVGQSKAEVIKVLGTPRSTEGQQNVEVLWYLEDQGAWRHINHYVRLVDGKVEAYGRAKNTTDVNLNIDSKSKVTVEP